MRGKNQKMGSTNCKGKLPKEGNEFNEEMDDEIDVFHKQRDKVPLNMNEDVEESDEDEEQPVFDFQGVNDDEDDDDEDDDDEDEDDPQDTGLAAKIVRQQRYLRAKFGGVEDSMHEDDEDEEETTKVVWGGKKHMYYDADNRDFEIQSSDGDSAKEEEAGVIDQRRERAKDLSMEDFGFEDTSQDGSDRELTLEEISTKGNIGKKIPLKKDATDDIDTAYEEVKKDLNALSREELTDVLMSSAPELVVLLSDLNDAIEQLENKVNPLLNKVKEGKIMVEGGIRYLEFKQLLLLSYCQSITFYLLLKSEGQTVQDHPVVARLLQIKSLLNETIELDGNLPAGLEKIINRSNEMEPVVKMVKKNGTPLSDFFEKDQLPSYILPEIPETTESRGNVDTETLEPSKDNKDKREKHKHENGQVGVQSMKMLKIRAALEEKLKQKGVFSSVAPKTDKAQKFLQPLNGQLESYDDFDDEAVNAEREIHQLHNVHASSLISDKNEKRSLNSKVSGVIALNLNKRKVISGDDDIPKSEDLGERRRKHELLLQARAAINSEDDADDETHMVGSDGGASMDEDGGSGDSEDEFYKQIKKEREAKLAAKAEIYSRNPVIPSLPETVDGKRQISYQIEKNRGLTRARKKLIKNPRKKYKLKHQKAVVRRKGQVREVKKPMGPYGGETSGINAGISRSVRFKS